MHVEHRPIQAECSAGVNTVLHAVGKGSALERSDFNVWILGILHAESKVS
jgi:hypothetical protein